MRHAQHFAPRLVITAVAVLSLTSGGLEPRAGRLAPVAGREPRRQVGRARVAEGLAAGRAAARLAGVGRGGPATRPSRWRTGGSTRWGRAAAPNTSWRSMPPAERRSGRRHTARCSATTWGMVPRGTPVLDGTQLYALGASGDLTVARCRDRQGDLDGQRAEEIRRQQHPLGAERIAAGAARSHPGQRRRARRLDRRAEEDRRLGDLAQPERRGRVLLRDPARPSAGFRRRSSSPRSGRSASTRATAGCSGATTASRTARRTSPRRSSAATACSCPPTTAPGRRCSS